MNALIRAKKWRTYELLLYLSPKQTVKSFRKSLNAILFFLDLLTDFCPEEGTLLPLHVSQVTVTTTQCICSNHTTQVHSQNCHVTKKRACYRYCELMRRTNNWRHSLSQCCWHEKTWSWFHCQASQLTGWAPAATAAVAAGDQGSTHVPGLPSSLPTNTLTASELANGAQTVQRQSFGTHSSTTRNVALSK